MNKICRTAAIAAIAAPLLVGSPAHAAQSAAKGNVEVFSTEFEKVQVYEHPAGCNKLPLTAHVLINNTDAPVGTYVDPYCLIRTMTVEPGYGAHVPSATGSFAVEDEESRRK
jgi:hypothetical protein